GVTENVSVGFAVPLIHYKNQMEIVANGASNVDILRQNLQGLNPQVDAGLAQASTMAANLPNTVQKILTAKGYKPIGLSEFNALGDTQIYARYRYLDDGTFRFAIRPYILLPTGRGDDPDDLG